MAEQNNKMREIEIEKVVLNCGGTEDKLKKSVNLLKLISGRKVREIASKKRIPTLGVRPGLKTGCCVTIRGKDKEELLKRLLSSIENTLKKRQIVENSFSFGIKEYLEVPGLEYQRDIGILGFEVTAVFKRKGKRVGLKKARGGRVPKKQHVTPEEITEFLKTKFNVEVN